MLVLSRQRGEGLLLDEGVELRVITFGPDYADLSVCRLDQRPMAVTIALCQPAIEITPGTRVVFIRASAERMRIGIEYAAGSRVERLDLSQS